MPRVVDHDARRRELALACFDLFATQGYGSATVKDMARAAKVSPGIFYHYFPDKRAVLDHMFAIVTAGDVERAEAILPPPGAGAAARVGAVRTFLGAHEAHLVRVLQVAMDVFRTDPDGRERLASTVDAYRRLLGQALGVDDGPILRLAFSWVLGELIQSQWEGVGQPADDLLLVWRALESAGALA